MCRYFILFFVSHVFFITACKSSILTKNFNDEMIERLYLKEKFKDLGEDLGRFQLHIMPETWQQARLRCHMEGSVLASPLRVELLQRMTSLMAEQRVPHIFTGISAIYSSGQFASIEGVPLEEIPCRWADAEPDNAMNREDCIALDGNGTMADVPCFRPLPYFCYKKNAQPADTGNQCHSEFNDYSFDSRTGKCYKLHRLGKSWPEAYDTCASERAHLVIVNSEVEAKVLRELIQKNPETTIHATTKDYFSAGFSDWSERGRAWMTIHGQTLQEAGYELWAPGEPSSYGGSEEYCGSISLSATLNDINCEEITPFICEKLPLVQTGKNLKDMIHTSLIRANFTDADLIYGQENLTRTVLIYTPTNLTDTDLIYARTDTIDGDLMYTHRNFTSADLIYSNVPDADVIKLQTNLADENLIFTQANLTGTNPNYTQTNLTDADLINTRENLTGTNPNYTQTNLTDADLINTRENLTDADLIYARPNLIDADLISTQTNLPDADLIYSKTNITDADLIYTQSNVPDADVIKLQTNLTDENLIFPRANLTGADPNYIQTNSTDADLINTLANLTDADLIYTRPNLIDSDLIYTRTNLTDEHLISTRPNLTDANLIYTQTNLTGADIVHTQLARANLIDTDHTKANLAVTDLIYTRENHTDADLVYTRANVTDEEPVFTRPDPTTADLVQKRLSAEFLEKLVKFANHIYDGSNITDILSILFPRPQWQ